MARLAPTAAGDGPHGATSDGRRLIPRWSHCDRGLKRVGNGVQMSQESVESPEPQSSEPALLDHEYDGIREYDNPTPGWWVMLFILTIIFSVF